MNENNHFGAVCHGDLCWGNILFKYSDEDQPKEVKFIDFQASRISSIVTDLLTFIFTSLSSTLRREYVGQALKVIHRILFFFTSQLVSLALPHNLRLELPGTQSYHQSLYVGRVKRRIPEESFVWFSGGNLVP